MRLGRALGSNARPSRGEASRTIKRGLIADLLGLVLAAIGQLPGLPFPIPVMPAFPLMRAPFLRDVNMVFEKTQFYDSIDSDVLARSHEVEPDATIETWVYNRLRGEELERYSYVYSQAILAARRLDGR